MLLPLAQAGSLTQILRDAVETGCQATGNMESQTLSRGHDDEYNISLAAAGEQI
jgi:hypothetical protein